MKKFLISLFLLFFAIVSMADEMPMLLSELDKAIKERPLYINCLLYTSDAADE